MLRIISTLQRIKDDVAKNTYSRNRFVKCIECIFSKSLHILLTYRICKLIHSTGFPLITTIHRTIQTYAFSCDISLESKLGGGIHLPHPIGITIGKGVIIGENCTLYQNTTLGAKKAEEYPTIQESVTIFPSTTVAGKIQIGKGSQIAANLFLDKSLPENSIFTGQSQHK